MTAIFVKLVQKANKSWYHEKSLVTRNTYVNMKAQPLIAKVKVLSAQPTLLGL